MVNKSNSSEKQTEQQTTKWLYRNLKTDRDGAPVIKSIADLYKFENGLDEGAR
jgi:hypothetical protein